MFKRPLAWAGPTQVLYDAIIVGGGPAGLSAALILGRALRHVLVVDDGQPRNAPADFSHGFLTRDGERPSELIRLARKDLEAYPTVVLTDDRALAVQKNDTGFGMHLASGKTVRAKKLLLATGVLDQLPNIIGLKDRWGKTVFVCPYCDGWEMKGRRIAIYGRSRDAVDLAQELIGWTKDLLICVERDELTSDDRRWIAASGAQVKLGRISSIAGDEGENILTFDDKTDDVCAALFLSAPLRQHSPLFALLGCELDAEGSVIVDRHFHSTIDGCFAAGDAVTTRHQVLIAAASGAAAAISLSCNLLEAEAHDLVTVGAEPVSRAASLP